MRLLNIETYELVDFTLKRPIPKYAILSHTWGEEEVSFSDLASPGRDELTGWTKVTNTCRLAREDGYAYVWIDTCCIDKSSSAELSEAINSMFAWYQQSAKCYVALSDVHDHEVESTMASRWWKRGWTLQELVAPKSLFFYDSSWTLISERGALVEEICKLTGIPVDVLEGKKDLESLCIAARMSWASERSTTRLEDEAYCLMGIFRVNMPLIYGEGLNAFQRLQHEIIRSTTDLSFLAHDRADGCGLLASSPEAFRRCRDLHRIPVSGINYEDHELAINNQGLKLQTAAFWPESCTGDDGRHYSLPVAQVVDYRYQCARVSVCFRRLGSKAFVRHPYCYATRKISYGFWPHHRQSWHNDDNVTLLFGGDEHKTSQWPGFPRIDLPSDEDLKIPKPFVYPSSAWNWEAREVHIPQGREFNSCFAIMSLDFKSLGHPTIVIQSGSFNSRPVGYFLRHRGNLFSSPLQDKIWQRLSRDNSLPNMQEWLEIEGRRSIRHVESNDINTFIAIAFDCDHDPSFRPIWKMRIEQISIQRHYLLKLKDCWLRNLPSSAKRLESEPRRTFQKLYGPEGKLQRG